MTELIKDDIVYMGSPLFEGKLPGGARWMKLDLGQGRARASASTRSR